MADPRIIDIALDDRTIIWRNADVEQERRIAIYDLLEENHFRPVVALERPCEGPFKLLLRVEEGRLAMDLSDGDSAPIGSISMGLAPFRRTIREYFAICDSYFNAIRSATPMQIETIDMARRGIHNDAAEQLKDRLAPKVEVDFDTARRLFTLICVLHIKS